MVEIYGYSIATIPVVCTVVYGIIEFLKYFFFSKNEIFKRFIPLISTVIGAVITLVAFFVCPDLIPVSAWYSALIVGGASGLSAVGINQIKKQIENKDGECGGA